MQTQLVHFNEKLFYEIKNVLIIQSNIFLKQFISHCQRINNKFRLLNNIFFKKWISISIFNKKFKFSASFISIISFMLNFIINFVNNVSNNDHHHDSMNFFVVIIDFRHFLINVEKVYNQKHWRKNDLYLYYDENDHLFKNCSHKFKNQLRIINFVVFSLSIIFILFSKIFDSKNV